MGQLTEEVKKASSPLELLYMKQIRLSFSIIDSWPHREMSTKNPIPIANNIFFFIIIIFVAIAEVIYLKNNVNVLSFLILGHTYITTLVTFNCLLRITLPWTKAYRHLIISFVENIHLFHFKEKSDYSIKTFNQIDNISSYLTKFLHYQIYAGVILFNVTPFINNARVGYFTESDFKNNTVELSIYYELPFDISSHFVGYICVAIFNFFFCLIITCITCINEFFISLIAIHIWGHLKILEHNLNNFPIPKRKIEITHKSLLEQHCYYSKEESVMVKELLKENINHHRLITEFLSKTVKVFGPTICLYYILQQILLCILLCEMSKLDTEAMGKYGILTVVILQQLIQLSIVFEVMGAMSQKIINAVYSLPWECMNVQNKKLILFFLQNVQVPIKVKAFDIVPIGVQTMVAILKTSYSYFIMLRSTAFD